MPIILLGIFKSVGCGGGIACRTYIYRVIRKALDFHVGHHMQIIFKLRICTLYICSMHESRLTYRNLNFSFKLKNMKILVFSLDPHISLRNPPPPPIKSCVFYSISAVLKIMYMATVPAQYFSIKCIYNSVMVMDQTSVE